jgi:hypothetical protein
LDTTLQSTYLELVAAAARRTAVFGAGVVAYSSGHGIHLPANSIGNARPGQTAHLWDEVVGHQVWFLGVVLLVGYLPATVALVVELFV